LKELEEFKQNTELLENNNQANKTKQGKVGDLETILEERDDEDKTSKISDRSEFKMEKYEKLDLKQRMITFKLKIFDKLDIKKIMNYWMEKRSYLKNKKKERTMIKSDDYKSAIKEQKKEKTKDSNNVKYEFKKPDENLLKIIPFCNNIFSIRKHDA